MSTRTRHSEQFSVDLGDDMTVHRLPVGRVGTRYWLAWVTTAPELPDHFGVHDVMTLEQGGRPVELDSGGGGGDDQEQFDHVAADLDPSQPLVVTYKAAGRPAVTERIDLSSL